MPNYKSHCQMGQSRNEHNVPLWAKIIRNWVKSISNFWHDTCSLIKQMPTKSRDQKKSCLIFNKNSQSCYKLNET